MSADNWRECPACGPAAVTRSEKLKAAYGKVSIEEYERLVYDARDDAPETSLREDYDIGTTKDGEFYVDYAGSCCECGWSFTYKHSERAK